MRKIQPSRLGWGRIPIGPCANAGRFLHFSTARRSGVANLCGRPGRGCNTLPPTPRSATRKCNPQGLPTRVMRGVSLLGQPISSEFLTCLKFMDHAAFRGFDTRARPWLAHRVLCLSDFDPLRQLRHGNAILDGARPAGRISFGAGPPTTNVCMARTCMLKREKMDRVSETAAWACLAAWAVRWLVPAGRNQDDADAYSTWFWAAFWCPASMETAKRPGASPQS